MDRPAPGGAAARIRALLPSLIPSEQRVARACLERAAEVTEWSAAELAAASGTSTATVVRACKNLGFRGFQHLRLVLAREGVRTSADGLAGEVEPGAAPEAVVASVFRTAAASLPPSLETLDGAEVARAVEILVGARRLLMSGSGASSPPVQDAALRFTCAGRPAEAPIDGVAQLFTARLLSPYDACVVVSHTGANEYSLAVARAARQAGATVIGVTSFAKSALCGVADVPLVVGIPDLSFELDAVTSRIAHVLLLNALEIAVSARLRDGGRNAAVSGLMDDLLTGDDVINRP
jgi:RpiR family transcriptional regulator, carbohydrate utilization regulator